MSLPSLYRTVLLLAGLSLSGISSGHAADWSRQVTDSHGTCMLEYKSQWIVPTSVILTGSLLVIDASVTASGAITPNNRVGDTQGSLHQWSEIAKEYKLSRLYIGEPSVKTVTAQIPDLILIGVTGDDSALALYDQLPVVAPMLIISYDDKSWQSLPTQLGEVIGQGQRAAVRVTEFDKQLQAVKQHIALSLQPVSALVCTAAARSVNLWTPESVQGKLMEQLGFTLATLPANLHTDQSRGGRHDTTQFGGENLAAGLSGETLFLSVGDSKDINAIYANPLLTHPSVMQNKCVYALGTGTFCLDYYSAMLLLRRLSTLF